MYSTLKTSKNQIIAYKSIQADPKKPHIVFLHGLRSSMESSKAVFLHEFCEKNKINFIRFDNLGSGESSGNFEDQTISSWLEATEEVIKNLCPNGAILVGSSKGGWLALLAALRNRLSIKAIVTIAAAPDFTEDMWGALSDEKRNQLKDGKIVEIATKPEYAYPIKLDLFEDAKQYCLLNQNMIPISTKVRLFHGRQDKEVSYKKSLDIFEKILSTDARCTIIKSGDHGLSRPEDLDLIAREILDLL